MLYSNYKNKILKLSAVRDFILRHKVAFCALLCAIIALFATFLGFKGKIYKELNQQEIVVYGDNYRSGGGALFAFMGYEYRKLGDDEWARGERPTAPGEYEVRGYALKGYGGKNYTEISTFTIKKREVTISVKENVITYGDGITAECELAKGDYLVEDKIRWNKSSIVNLKFNASVQLNSVEIRNKKGENVTDYYNIRCISETVSVNKRVISVKVDGAEKEYDGTYLSCSKYEITSGSTADGERLNLSFNDNIRDFGVMENKPDWSVTNNYGLNVSQFYDVIFDCGFLSITKRKITLKGVSDSKVYDGIPLVNQTFEVVSEKGLIYGDSAIISDYTTLTLSDSIENIFKVDIYRGYEKITENYDIEYIYGNLTEKKRAITISSYSGRHIYNGEEQTYAHFWVSNGSLGSGDVAYSYNPASLKNVGSTENTLEVRIYRPTGEESTLSYDISYTYGSLTIEKRSVTLKPKDVYKPYDALPLESDECEVGGGSLASGHRAEIKTSGSITVVGSFTNIITDFEIYDFENNVVTDNYKVTTQSGVLTVTQRNISIRPKAVEKVYDGKPLTPTEFEITTSVGLVEGHRFSSVTYAGSQTKAGKSDSKIASWKILDENGLDVSNYYRVTLLSGSLTVLGKDLIVKTSSASKIYDGTELESREYSVEGLLPGDYCFISYATSVVDYREGGYDNVLTVLVYDSQNYPVWDNYNVIYEYGKLTIEKKRVDVNLFDVSKVYDALPLYIENFECVGLIKGHYAVVDVDDYIVDVGSKTVSAKEINVYDQNDIDKTHNYEFNCYDATLTVTKRSITIKPTDEKKEYDRTPLTSFNAETTVNSNYKLCYGHSVEITSTKSITEIGEIHNNAIDTCVIKDADGNDVTENYSIETTYGSLTVETIKLVVRPNEIKTSYDGSIVEITNEDYWILDGELLSGHEISMQIEISQNGLKETAQEAGTYDVIATEFYILINGIPATIDSEFTDGENVVILTDHYEVTLLKSLIEIKKKKVYVSTESKSVVYDESITDPNASLVSVDNNSVTVDFRAVSWVENYELPSFTNAIYLYEYQEGVTKKINLFDTSLIKFYRYENGEKIDTTDNYEIIADFGTLNVTKY